jgi:hypothetical protein
MFVTWKVKVVSKGFYDFFKPLNLVWAAAQADVGLGL